jgi:hypothetical protein
VEVVSRVEARLRLARLVRRDERRRCESAEGPRARNSQLKGMVADKEPEIDALREVAKGNW